MQASPSTQLVLARPLRCRGSRLMSWCAEMQRCAARVRQKQTTLKRLTALFVSPCSFHHPHARVHLSPPNALTFSVHVQALAAGFRRESAILAPNPPNPTIDPLLIPPTTPL